MKNLNYVIFGLLILAFFCSCGPSQYPNSEPDAGFGMAFHHLWTETNYRWIVLLSTVIAAGGWLYVYVKIANKEIQDSTLLWPTIAFLALMFILWGVIPGSLGGSTLLKHALVGKWGF